jgi:hypothetical protein
MAGTPSHFAFESASPERVVLKADVVPGFRTYKNGRNYDFCPNIFR